MATSEFRLVLLALTCCCLFCMVCSTLLLFSRIEVPPWFAAIGTGAIISIAAVSRPPRTNGNAP